MKPGECHRKKQLFSGRSATDVRCCGMLSIPAEQLLVVEHHSRIRLCVVPVSQRQSSTLVVSMITCRKQDAPTQIAVGLQFTRGRDTASA